MEVSEKFIINKVDVTIVIKVNKEELLLIKTHTLFSFINKSVHVTEDDESKCCIIHKI